MLHNSVGGGVAYHAGASSQHGEINAETPVEKGGVGGGPASHCDAGVEMLDSGAKCLFAMSAAYWEQGSTRGKEGRAADAVAVLGPEKPGECDAGTTLVDAEVAALHPELNLPSNLASDAAAVSGCAATTHASGAVAVLLPDVHGPDETEMDVARSVKTTMTEDDDGAPSVPAAGEEALRPARVICRNYRCD